MSSVKERASNAPPAPKELTAVLRWLEVNVRKPLEGTWFDRLIATPAKEFYIGAKRLE
jgi:hypothetical protein